MKIGEWTTTRCDSAQCVKIRPNIDGTISIGSTQDTTVLNVSQGEWDAFVAGIIKGDFDL